MDNSFLHGFRKIKKQIKGNFNSTFFAETGELFGKNLKLPESMIEELVNNFAPSEEPFDEAIEKMADIVDLFDETLPDNNVLEENDWILIRDLVNGYAADMDMDTVTYIMAMIVEQGYL